MAKEKSKKEPNAGKKGLEAYLPTGDDDLVAVQAKVDRELVEQVKKKLKGNRLKLCDLIRGGFEWYLAEGGDSAEGAPSPKPRAKKTKKATA